MEAHGDLKKQRTVLEMMKIEISVETSLVIKRARVWSYVSLNELALLNFLST